MRGVERSRVDRRGARGGARAGRRVGPLAHRDRRLGRLGALRTGPRGVGAARRRRAEGRSDAHAGPGLRRRRRGMARLRQPQRRRHAARRRHRRGAARRDRGRARRTRLARGVVRTALRRGAEPPASPAERADLGRGRRADTRRARFCRRPGTARLAHASHRRRVGHRAGSLDRSVPAAGRHRSRRRGGLDRLVRRPRDRCHPHRAAALSGWPHASG